MLPPALGGLRVCVPPVPGHHAPGSMSKITLPSGYPHDIKIILFLIRFRQLAILPNFFGIDVDVVWPAKSTAFRLNLSEEDGVAQLAPIVFLEIRRAVKDADRAVLKRHLDKPIVHRLSLYDLVQDFHADTHTA